MVEVEEIEILEVFGAPGGMLSTRSSFGRWLEVLKSRAKAFHDRNQVQAGSTGARKCVSGAGKVFSGRNGEYLGPVGPLWWHMVDVEKIENFEIFQPPWGAAGGSQNACVFFTKYAKETKAFLGNRNKS